MKNQWIEVDVCYTDNFIKLYLMPEDEVPALMSKLKDDTISTFELAGKEFLKSEVAALGFGSWAVQLTHEEVEEEEKD